MVERGVCVVMHLAITVVVSRPRFDMPFFAPSHAHHPMSTYPPANVSVGGIVVALYRIAWPQVLLSGLPSSRPGHQTDTHPPRPNQPDLLTDKSINPHARALDWTRGHGNLAENLPPPKGTCLGAQLQEPNKAAAAPTPDTYSAHRLLGVPACHDRVGTV